MPTISACRPRSTPASSARIATGFCAVRASWWPNRPRVTRPNSRAKIATSTSACMRSFFDRRLRAAMTDELRAQVERHLELVGYLNHIDGHLNFHVHPLFADILVNLAVEYKVPCIRLPRERVMTTIRLRRDNVVRKLVESIIFRTLSRRTSRMMIARGLTSTDALFGLHQSGHLSEDYVVGVIDRIRDGTTELYFHPAADIGGIPPTPAAQLEVEILTSQRVHNAIVRNGIELITFADLAKDKLAA